MPIYLNGRAVPIRRNLHQALLRLRHQTAVRYLWVDAISISQDDLHEKAAQVQMIGMIFSSAERVLVWLGEHANGSRELFRGWQNSDDVDRILDPDSATDRNEISRRLLIWIAFLKLPYWNRTWVVQEIALAKHPVIHCGEDCVDWADIVGSRLQYANEDGNNDIIDGLPARGAVFQVVPTQMQPYDDLVDGFRDRASHVWILHLLWRAAASRYTRNILEFVQELDEYRCENKLDRVYALLSLEAIAQAHYPIIKVNYSLSLPQLVLEVLTKSYVLRPKRRKLDNLAKEAQVTYISLVFWALDFTLEECDEMMRLVLWKLERAEAAEDPLIADRWAIVRAGVQIRSEEL